MATTYPYCGHCGYDVQAQDSGTVGRCDSCGADYTENEITIGTTATAGVPGSFNGQVIPNNLAQAVARATIASPTSDWTVGQSVFLADGSEMHYDTSAWVTGAAS